MPPLQLTIEVVEQLRKMFQPDPRMIKKQVESLIDREYLERDTVSAFRVPNLHVAVHFTVPLFCTQLPVDSASRLLLALMLSVGTVVQPLAALPSVYVGSSLLAAAE